MNEFEANEKIVSLKDMINKKYVERSSGKTKTVYQIVSHAIIWNNSLTGKYEIRILFKEGILFVRADDFDAHYRPL